MFRLILALIFISFITSESRATSTSCLVNLRDTKLLGKGNDVRHMQDQSWAVFEIEPPNISHDRLREVYGQVANRPGFSATIFTELTQTTSSTAIKGFTKQEQEELMRWANEYLEKAKQAYPDEDFYVENMNLAVGFNAGNSVVHLDNTGFLHGTQTVSGNSTIVFPNEVKQRINQVMKGNRNVRVVEQNPDGSIRLEGMVREGDPPTITLTSDEYVQSNSGDALFFTQTNFANLTQGSEATLHSSPLGKDPDRITLFVSIARKKPTYRIEDTYRNINAVFDLDAKQAESLRHQEDIMDAVTDSTSLRSYLQKMKIDINNLRLGMMQSDLGKLKEYQKLLLNGSEESNTLLDMLRGKGDPQMVKALREVLDQGGLQGKWLLNPNLTNAQIRLMIQKNPILLGYLHELPGIIEGIKAYKSGGSLNDLKKQLETNLFHNGPNEGFWNLLSQQFVPAAMQADLQKFFKDTVFYNGAKGGLEYPSPVSREGVVHTILDRTSQATRGGIRKIFEEIREVPGPTLAKINELMSTNPFNTQKQLDVLKQHIKQNFPGKDGEDLDFLTRKYAERITTMQRFIEKNAEIKNTLNSHELTLNFVNKNDQNIVTYIYQGADEIRIETKIDGVAQPVQRYEKGSEDFYNTVRDTVDNFLEYEENLNGNPMRDVQL